MSEWVGGWVGARVVSDRRADEKQCLSNIERRKLFLSVDDGN